MNRKSIRSQWISGVAAFVSLTSLATGIGYSLAIEQFGNAPLSAANYSSWLGIMPVINNQCRVYQRWVNGDERLFYTGKTDALNNFLRDYSSANLGTHRVILKDGMGQTKSLGGKTVAYNWELHLISGIAAHVSGATDPTVVVYNDGSAIESSKIIVPDKLRIEK